MALKPAGRQGLSSRDLDFLVERIYTKQEGRRHQISDYWKTSVEQRTLRAIERQIGEAITQQGLLRYFEENGILIDRSRLITKLVIINRNPQFNILSALWSAASLSKGVPPVLLPEGSFKLKPEEFTTLMLKGLASPEGQMIAKRYEVRFEANRGYDIFSRYYTRFAFVVLLYVVYDKSQDFVEKGGDPSFAALMNELEKYLPSE